MSFDVDSAVKIGQSFGVPVLLLLILLCALWRAASWFGPRIDQFLTAHHQFVQSTRESNTRVEEIVRASSANIEKVLEAVRK